MTTETNSLPLPSYPAPEPGPGLAGLEPEIAQIVEALEHLGQVQPVLLAAVGRGHEALEGLETAGYYLRKTLAERAADSIGYRVEIEEP